MGWVGGRDAMNVSHHTPPRNQRPPLSLPRPRPRSPPRPPLPPALPPRSAPRPPLAPAMPPRSPPRPPLAPALPPRSPPLHSGASPLPFPPRGLFPLPPTPGLRTSDAFSVGRPPSSFPARTPSAFVQRGFLCFRVGAPPAALSAVPAAVVGPRG